MFDLSPWSWHASSSPSRSLSTSCSRRMGIDTSVIWARIVYFAVFMYVLLDGSDLGIGMLFPFARDKRDRDSR